LHVKNRGCESAISWFDTHKSDTENLQVSVNVLKAIRDQKCIVDVVRGRDDEASLELLMNVLKSSFDKCFSESDEVDYEIEVDDNLFNME
jgi:hypothetical protein